MYNPSVTWCVQTCWLCALEVDQLICSGNLSAPKGHFTKLALIVYDGCATSTSELFNWNDWLWGKQWLKNKNCSYLDFVRLFWSVSDYLLITLSWMFITDPNSFIYILLWLRCSVPLFLIKSQIIHFRECQIFFHRGGAGISVNELAIIFFLLQAIITISAFENPLSVNL